MSSTAPVMRRALELAQRSAATDLSVLISGESGTGKGVLARWIHGASERWTGPFVTLDCSALTDETAAPILFGVEKGGDAAGYFGCIERAGGHVAARRGR